jgi:hypothetical protein
MGMAQENSVEVRIAAEASALKPGMDNAAADVEKSAERMRNSISSMKDAVQGHMAQMSNHVKAANDDMGGSFGGLIGSFGKVSGALAAVGAILAGGAVFKGGVEESKKLTGEANALGRALGISTTEAGALNIALGDIYSSSETFIGAASMLGRQLRTNEEGLNAMGLKTRDANGELRNMKDLMFDGIAVLNGYKEGTDRNLAAQAMFGRGGAEVMAMLKLNNEVLEQAKEKQEALGLVVGVENVAAAKAYKAAMNDVGDVMSAIRKAIGDAVMPVLTKMGEWFASIGPAAVTVIKGAIGGLTASFWALKNGVVVLWETINAMVVSVAEPIRALAEAISRAMAGDFEGAKAAMVSVPGTVGAAWKAAFKEISDSSGETREKIGNLFNRPTDTAPKSGKGKSYVAPEDNKPGKAATEKTRMPAWEAELAQQKSAFMLQNDMYEMTLAQEKQFWDDKLAIVDKKDKEYGALTKKSAELELQILKKKALDGRGLAIEDIEEWKRTASAGIEIQAQAANQAYALGEINDEQRLDLERSFEQQRYDIAAMAIQERIALMEKDPNMSKVEYQKLKNQLLEIDRKHIMDKQQLENSIKVASVQPQMRVFETMQQSFAQAVTGMLTRAQTLRQGLNNIFHSILSSFVQNMVVQPLAEWGMGLLRQTALYQMFFGTKATLEATGAATTTATKAGEATAVVSANAAEAASGAAASVSSIPFVGWAMAAGVFAAVMAMVMGATGSIKSASGGYDIPSGVNPVTQLHEDEMVLPAHIANPLRKNLNGGESDMGGSGGGSGLPPIYISAMDSRDVARALKQGGALHKALKDLERRGVIKK